MTLKQFILLLFTACGLFVVRSPGLAEVYMYRDKNGVVTFTNVPNHSGFRPVVAKVPGIVPGSSGYGTNYYEDIILSASNRHSIDADLVRAVIKVESDFNSNARSHKGAMGLMQLMPETARLYNVTDIYDPNENIEGGVRHLKLLLNRFQGDVQLTLAAYNAGIGAVEKHGGIPPFAETQEYVRRVLRLYQSHGFNGLKTIPQLR